MQSAAGGITSALDLSDPEIVNALSLGANDITATYFSLDGATGNVTSSGDMAVNGGDLTTTAATATLFNTGATNLSVGGAATTLTLGATSGTASIRNTTISFPNATAVNAPQPRPVSVRLMLVVVMVLPESLCLPRVTSRLMEP